MPALSKPAGRKNSRTVADSSRLEAERLQESSSPRRDFVADFETLREPLILRFHPPRHKDSKETSVLLRAKSDERIDSSRAAGREVARHEGHQSQNSGD